MYNERQKYLEEFLAELSLVFFQPIYVAWQTIGVDYRFVEIKSLPKKSSVPIVLLTGWGSGYEGILPLAFSLACEGYKIILISLPGYGNSENPGPDFYGSDLYHNFASAVLIVLKKLGIKEAYFVGHSMGAEILAHAASVWGHTCHKLVLLHPTGLWPVVGFQAKLALFWRFAASGTRLRKEYYQSPKSQDNYLKPLIDLCGQQTSPWRGRLPQRWAEFKEICRGGLPHTLSFVFLPVVFISGSRDTVFDAQKSLLIIERAYKCQELEWEIIPENHHNPTLFNPEQTASDIAEHLP